MAECKAGPSWAVSIMSTSGPHDIFEPFQVIVNTAELSGNDVLTMEFESYVGGSGTTQLKLTE